MEFFVRKLISVFASQKEMLLPMAVVLAVTLLLLIVFGILLAASKNDRHFYRRFGFFLCLGGNGSVRMSCAWIRLLLLIFFLVVPRKMDVPYYIMIFVPGLVGSLFQKQIRRKLGGIFWLFVELVGLLSANLIYGFMKDTDAGVLFVLIYIGMSMCLLLFGVYLFLLDARSISDERKINIDREREKIGI